MIEQEIEIQCSDDPFDVKMVKVKLPKGVKVTSSEPYTLELLKAYGYLEDNVPSSNIPDGSMVEGEIVSMSEKMALIDIGGGKFTAVCMLDKESKDIVEQLKVGKMVTVSIKYKGNGEYFASISDAMRVKLKQDIKNSIGNTEVAYEGKVVELIDGAGYWVDILGVKCFMPGSLGALNKIQDFESLLGKTLVFMPINYSDEKNTIVVSHREYLRSLIPSAILNLKKNMKEEITGIVTGTTKFGVFAEFNTCLTGLIPAESLEGENLERFNSKNIKPGDEISFWVNNIISNNKIILTQKGPKYDPWDDAAVKFEPGSIVNGKVTKVTNYGAFVELSKGVSGLIHKTQIKGTVLHKGDFIDVKIIQVNPNERKISMTLPNVTIN